jgi:fatty-acid peroxygenase
MPPLDLLTRAAAVAGTLDSAVAPRAPGLDSTVALFREGYLFGSRRFAQCGRDLFQTRVTGRNAVFMYGEEAARQFYAPGRMTRRHALPLPSLALLLDLGSVAMLDGPAHAHRKQMFLGLMTPEALTEIGDLVEQWWRDVLPAWQRGGRLVLLDGVHEVLCRAVCAWAGVPLPDEDVVQRTREFAAMVDGAGSPGPRNLRGQVLRHRAEQWVRDVVRRIRSGELHVEPGRAAHVIAMHRGLDGELLDVDHAAVEIVNVLRPTVAVARFVVFAAHALHEQPEQRELVAQDDAARDRFVQEVRRYYPFFPVIAGRVREPFAWRGARFRPGTWLLLDLYATCHDDRLWEAPGQFRPERFAGRNVTPYDLVPQGGGDHEAGHRCAGEWLTMEVLRRAVRLLTTAMAYDVPPQDLTITLHRMPAVPRSRFVLADVRPL